jgi:thymidylate kinase
MQGKFIAIYGINNIGKSTQTSLLVQKLVNAGVPVEYIKYPIYDLDPTGKMLNEILRGKQKHSVQSVIEFFEGTKVRRPNSKRKPVVSFRKKAIASKEIRQRVTEEELQMWYSLNRYQYDPQTRKKLASGTTIVAEDYTGTGLAWGAAKGADLGWLNEVNKFLQKPDLEILIDGERFLAGKEKVHLHESSDRLIGKARKSFQVLAKKNKWQTVDANQTIEEVSTDLWACVEPLFKKSEIRREDETFTSWQPNSPELNSPSL